jgi:hypothetical protein
MPAKTLSVAFDGYWRQPNTSGIPRASCVYVVYECSYNVTAGTATPHRVLYIGESDAMRPN